MKSAMIKVERRDWIHKNGGKYWLTFMFNGILGYMEWAFCFLEDLMANFSCLLHFNSFASIDAKIYLFYKSFALIYQIRPISYIKF